MGATPMGDKRSSVWTQACGGGADMRGIPCTGSGPRELLFLSNCAAGKSLLGVCPLSLSLPSLACSLVMDGMGKNLGVFFFGGSRLRHLFPQ